MTRHDHVFLGAGHDRNERRTRLVVGLTAAFMVVEIAAGAAFGSMALLADGLHMATHAGALGIAAAAYAYSRRHARDPGFSFGTGKVGDLAAFASAVVLAVVALAIAVESAGRLFAPVEIRFGEATLVAAIGLVVNVISARLLHAGPAAGEHDLHHHHAHAGQGHRDGHADLNLRAAYLHVLADAATSVLAIIGLVAARYLGWSWLDPLIGLAGAALIARWSVGLLRQSGRTLLDVVPDTDRLGAVRAAIEAPGDAEVLDLHLWRVGPGHEALVVSVQASRPLAPCEVRARLARFDRLSHVTVEVCAARPEAWRRAA